LHRADGAGHINGEADVSAHALLVRAQTPQGFKRTLLLESLEAAPPGVRDDATAVLQSGGGVATVPGEETNIKITYPSDLSLAEAIAAHL
jgi:2-C-methyl-D-erythritol 4-phosphate cytidylyltransferase/2-C-methyl-D-erythritol 2,4-cyclodiphosphate synthase